MGRDGHHIIYGTVAFGRGYCNDCGNTALIREGRLLCCDRVYTRELEGVKYEVEPRGKRKLPPLEHRNLVLVLQENKCFYCAQEFGTWERHRRKLIQLRVNWDHLLPFAYLQSNPTFNFVAACQLCNGIKGSKIFDKLIELKEYVRAKRQIQAPREEVRKLYEAVYPEKKTSNILQPKLPRKILARQEPKVQDFGKLVGQKNNCTKCSACFVIYKPEQTLCWNCIYNGVDKLKLNISLTEKSLLNVEYKYDSSSEEWIRIEPSIEWVKLQLSVQSDFWEIKC